MSHPYLKLAALTLAALVGLSGCAAADGAPAMEDGADARHELGTDHATGAEHELGAEHTMPGNAVPAGHADHGAGEPLAPASDMSLYHLDAVWTDQHGQERTLASLAGRPQAVAMVYTHCSAACPQLVLDLMRLEAAAPAGSLGLVLVSIDPARDTPERLGAFAAKAGLDPERWTLLTGTDGHVRALAALLGVQYRQAGEDFNHSNVISLLDAGGVVAHRQEGLAADNSATVAALEKLLAEG
ncbi:MAG: SCO family protein [Gemmatimonadota bacterium]